MNKSTEAINLFRARLCLDCEPGTIHHADVCPMCGSHVWHYVHDWLDPNYRPRLFGPREILFTAHEGMTP
jgi:hypothetical protein